MSEVQSRRAVIILVCRLKRQEAAACLSSQPLTVAQHGLHGNETLTLGSLRSLVRARSPTRNRLVAVVNSGSGRDHCEGGLARLTRHHTPTPVWHSYSTRVSTPAIDRYILIHGSLRDYISAAEFSTRRNNDSELHALEQPRPWGNSSVSSSSVRVTAVPTRPGSKLTPCARLQVL